MTHLVIVVALSAQQIAYPVEQGDFRVGVMAAHHENDAVNQDQPVGQAGEGKAFQVKVSTARQMIAGRVSETR